MNRPECYENAIGSLPPYDRADLKRYIEYLERKVSHHKRIFDASLLNTGGDGWGL